MRSWNQNDAEVFAAINQDEKVIEFLRSAMSLKDCHDFIAETNCHIEKFGFSLWAAEFKEAKELIGFVGLRIPDFESHFTPCVEIGWRLAFKHWGKGYATESSKSIKSWFWKF